MLEFVFIVTWSTVGAFYFCGYGFHKRPPSVALEFFDLIVMNVINFIAYSSFFHMGGTYQ